MILKQLRRATKRQIFSYAQDLPGTREWGGEAIRELVTHFTNKGQKKEKAWLIHKLNGPREKGSKTVSVTNDFGHLGKRI